MAEAIGLKVDDARFWDAEDLRSEVDRIFDICHSCRLCFKFCGSFPRLFELIDGKTERMRADYLTAHPEVAAAAAERRREAEAAPPVHADPEAEVGVTYGDELPELTSRARDLSHAEIDEVVDLCFQCKLCYPNCPYTPPHEFALDFPRLLLRWKAQRVRRQGLSFKTRLLRDTALIGKAASALPGLSNWALRSPLQRAVMERTTGIHREKLMPTYYGRTFPRWWRKHRPNVETAQAPREGVTVQMPLKVALLSTCVVDYNDPSCGTAAVRVLEHNGVEVVRPAGQVCCGMPFLDEGDLDTAQKLARRNVDAFAGLVADGYAVVIPSPSCSLMVREELPQLVADERTTALARASYDLDDYLYRLAREGRLKRDFKRRFGRVQYHVPCHIRVQNVGIRGRDLLRIIADEVEAVQECSGHDGTWSMHVDHFRDSLRWGQKAFAGMRAHAGEPCALACSDCRLAALHIRQGADRATVHPVVALAHAYGFDVDAPAPLASRPVDES
jgi:glycerol-3-phosphate dehydrogenase subunit C